MRPPQRSYRTIAPVFFGLQALLLISCEASRTLDPLSADGLTPSEQRNGRHTASIVISAPDSALAPGQRVQASAIVKDQRGNVIQKAAVAWSTASNDIVDVSSTGLLTGGTTDGTTTVSATMDGISRSMTVSVSASESVGDTTSAVPGDTTTTSDTTAAG